MYTYVCVIYIYIYIIDLLKLINNQLGEMKTLVLAMGCTSVGCEIYLYSYVSMYAYACVIYIYIYLL